MNRILRFGLFTAFLSSALCHAATPTLKEGDPAPSLQVGKWVQGDPVAGFEKGKAYIVEFWATWCGPCRVSIPHLNDIHLKFKDKGLVVIGQDCWENEEADVAPFVKKMGDKMTYRVALDRVENGEARNGKMAKTWMEAAGQNGIPSAFVVNRSGILAWVGHPMELKDSVIQAILEDRYDIKQESAKRAEIDQLSTTFYKKLQAKELEGAAEVLHQLETKVDESDLTSSRIELLSAKRDFKGAFAVLEKKRPRVNPEPISEDASSDFNGFAWSIAIDKEATKADLELALKSAERGVAASKGEDAAVLDSQARILFRLGKQDEAIRIQKKAVKFSSGRLKELVSKTLESYRKGTLPEE